MCIVCAMARLSTSADPSEDANDTMVSTWKCRVFELEEENGNLRNNQQKRR